MVVVIDDILVDLKGFVVPRSEGHVVQKNRLHSLHDDSGFEDRTSFHSSGVYSLSSVGVANSCFRFQQRRVSVLRKVVRFCVCVVLHVYL